MENETRAWSEWLAQKLDERSWRQADLVRNSEGEIKRDRASKWLSGKETPSYRLAIIVANTLGVDRDEAIIAAGYLPTAAAENFPKTRAWVLEDFSDEELLEELQRRAKKREGQPATDELAARRQARTSDVGGSAETVDLHTVDLDEIADELAASDDDSAIDPSRGDA